MMSILIPAHNEADVIAASVAGVCAGADPNELEVIVICNGCKDATAAAAKVPDAPVRVIETPVPSKSEAINLGLDAARGEHVVVMDADVRMQKADLAALAAALSRDGVLAAAPAARMEFLPGTDWKVHAFYRFWTSLSYVKEGMMAAGVYSVNAAGKSRLGRLPRVIADDGYVRMLFNDAERVEVAGAISTVLAPVTLTDLVKIRTRSRLGWYELQSRFPQLFTREVGKRKYLRAWIASLIVPTRWPAACVYLYVNIVSRARAKKQAKNFSAYTWERDDGSRRAFADASRQNARDGSRETGAPRTATSETESNGKGG
jgi:glycosyltransferase involved in cell wall biosynthesis